MNFFTFDSDHECPGITSKLSPSKEYMSASIKYISHDSNQNQWDSTNVTFECTDHHACSCKKYKVYHSYYFEEQVPTEVVEILGIYDKLESTENSFGVLSFKHQSKDIHLFSLHPKGRVWSIGQGLTIADTEASRIDFESYDENLCPHYGSHNDFHWKIFKQKTEQGQEIWETSNVEVACIECPANYFLCPESGDCVPHCDGHKECGNGIDEIKCPDCQNAFRCPLNGECIPHNKHCDGIPDCIDGHDEIADCTICQDQDMFQCLSDGKCIQKDQHCDGNPDCRYGYDEKYNCALCHDTNKFQCPTNGICISWSKHCDNIPDCEDGHDEQYNCSSCSQKNMFECRDSFSSISET